MCFNELDERSVLPDCHIANRVFLFSLLQSLQEQERRPEDVDVELRDRYNVFRQVLPNYPLPELESPEIQSYFEGYQQEQHSVSLSMDSNSSGEDTSDTSLDSDPGQIAISANRTD
ncbi:uncharacterized protein [Drosophila takahashii]|uniref:uncharacterized protein n=1 Tax=Drosophila takahashii TaxID=29030 RepID=UPI001CF7FC56|nr:uncharacterized protein LOC108069132 [Drosophila takahashii]